MAAAKMYLKEYILLWGFAYWYLVLNGAKSSLQHT